LAAVRMIIIIHCGAGDSQHSGHDGHQGSPVRSELASHPHHADRDPAKAFFTMSP
jgi:hypothetical protein